MNAMLTPDELSSLSSLLDRARRADSRNRGAALAAIAPGDVVQLRPGINHTWETSLLLVMETDARQVRGQILQPHRSGCQAAWGRFAPGEVLRVGRAPFAEPATEIKEACYQPPCDLGSRKPPAAADAVNYRDHYNASSASIADAVQRAHEIDAERVTAQRAKRRAKRSLGHTVRSETP